MADPGLCAAVQGGLDHELALHAEPPAARLDRADEALGIERGRRGEREERPPVARLDLLEAERPRRDADPYDVQEALGRLGRCAEADRKSTRLNSSHSQISYAVFC